MTARQIRTFITDLEQGRKGYVLNFNRTTLSDFIFNSIEVDIEKEPYEEQSMSNMLTQVLTIESKDLVTKLVNDLLSTPEEIRTNSLLSGITTVVKNNTNGSPMDEIDVDVVIEAIRDAINTHEGNDDQSNEGSF